MSTKAELLEKIRCDVEDLQCLLKEQDVERKEVLLKLYALRTPEQWAKRLNVPVEDINL